MKRAACALVCAAVLLVSRAAAGQDAGPPPDATEPDTELHLRVWSPGVIITDTGAAARIPPGRYLAEPLWLRLDTEVRRLQDAETRLAAENKSLRDAPGGRGWVWGLVIGLATGAAGTWYLTK